MFVFEGLGEEGGVLRRGSAMGHGGDKLYLYYEGSGKKS